MLLRAPAVGFRVANGRVNERDFEKWARETQAVSGDGTPYATDVEAAALASAAQAAAIANASSALATHVAAPDPHPQYLLTAEGNAAYVSQTSVLNGSATYDPPSLADAVGVTTTVTVTGAALGDFALASFSLDLQGIAVSAYVSAADTVSVRFQNESGGTLDLASGTLRARVWKL